MEGFSDQGFHGGRFFGQEGHGEESMPSNSMRDFHLDRLFYSDCDGRHDFLDHNHDVSYGELNYLDHNRNGSARFRRDFGFDFHNGKYQSQNHNFGISVFRHANLYQGLVKPRGRSRTVTVEPGKTSSESDFYLYFIQEK